MFPNLWGHGDGIGVTLYCDDDVRSLNAIKISGGSYHDRHLSSTYIIRMQTCTKVTLKGRTKHTKFLRRGRRWNVEDKGRVEEMGGYT